jgi:4-amino-4-deoxy-L-arabinose transferase-like glycosyltransferase
MTGLTDRPQGFYLDESSFSWNAWTIVQDGVDEFGRPWPLFFESFGDWKTGPYIYMLSGVYALTGPSILAARALSAVAGLATVFLLAWLAYRWTKRPAVALLTGAAALLNPWTFEPTRLALEVAFMPALVAAYLVVLYVRPPTRERWVSSALTLAVILGLITYTYTLGRLLGPLLAFGLVLYASHRNWKGIVATWVVYTVLLVPLLAFAATNPGALTVRLAEAGYLGGPLPEVVGRFVGQLLGNVDPGRALWVGDLNERHHVAGIMGSLLVGTLVLALVGIVRVAREAARDPWSRYLLYGARSRTSRRRSRPIRSTSTGSSPCRSSSSR